jgi:hypothetical protein
MTREIVREITQEQYIKATQEHCVDGIFSQAEVCGYGVYNERFYKSDDKYYCKFQLGTSCD